MKNYKFLILLLIANLCFFCFQTNAQNTEFKVSKAEEKQVADFVDSFIKSYRETFDLTQVPTSYFIDDYKKRNNLSFFIDKYDQHLTDEEKFQNYFMLLDLLQIVFFQRLKESNFDLRKMFKDAEEELDKDFFFTKSMLEILKKYPKANSFMLKENFSQINNVRDFRDAIQDFRSFLQELRTTVNPDSKVKYDNTLQKAKNRFFKLDYGVECSKQVKFCGDISDKTKMYYYVALPFVFLIANLDGKFKIVMIFPPTD